MNERGKKNALRKEKKMTSLEERRQEIKNNLANEVVHDPDLFVINKAGNDDETDDDEIFPGPFTSSESATAFIESKPDSKDKNHRIYMEISFQRNVIPLEEKQK